jgi:neutral trehalase
MAHNNSSDEIEPQRIESEVGSVNRRTFLGAAAGTGASVTLSSLPNNTTSTSASSDPSPVNHPDAVPHPILENHSEWVELYYKAWEIAESKVQSGTDQNNFVDRYLDEGFNPHIFQWDTCFVMFFAKYANGFVPSIQSLDNFYRNQHENGAICREIRESDGSDFWSQNNPAYTNPPLFAWAEWDYYKYTGDDSRFDRVLPILDEYFHWCKRNRTIPNGMYWWNQLASGMDNSPRPALANEQVGGWIDYTAQQALAAYYIREMAEVACNETLKTKYDNEYQSLKALVNQLCWNESDGLYWDLFVSDGSASQVKTKTAACFWPMIARLTDDKKAKQLVSHLTNVTEFYRPNLFPTLAGDHPEYEWDGGYWRGGIWAPTNMMYVKGLQTMGYEDLATEAAMNHIEEMSQVYQNIQPHTIWENYAPEVDHQGEARPKFVGWSGNGAITFLLENVIGIRVNDPEETIEWRPTLVEQHGIKNLKLGDATVNLVAEARNPGETVNIQVETETSFTLIIHGETESYNHDLDAGTHEITVPPLQNIALPSDQAAIDITFAGKEAAAVQPGETVKARTTLSNMGVDPLKGVSFQIHAPTDWKVESSNTQSSNVAPRESVSDEWKITAPSDTAAKGDDEPVAAFSTYYLIAEATFSYYSSDESRRDSVVAVVPEDDIADLPGIV